MIEYTNTRNLTAEQLAQIFNNSGLKRPTNNLERLENMLKNCDILWTAWEDDQPIGVARALTDYSYVCYLSDLAIDQK